MSIQTNVIREPESNYRHVTVTSDNINKITWCVMNNDETASFTDEVLDELNTTQPHISSAGEQHFYVLSSASEAVFSLGGDLTLFQKCIKQKNRQALHLYMKKCIDTLYNITASPEVEKIALVRGAAFGGGFEAVLACDTIIAEKSATFGFPERLFNLFPGMGAYSFLIRRIEPSKAQKMIKSAKTYTAEELFDMGIVDKLVPDGGGHDAVYNYVQNYKRYNNSYNSLKQVFQTFSPIKYDELLQIGELWVNSALRLSDKDIGLMQRLAESQARLIEKG